MRANELAYVKHLGECLAAVVLSVLLKDKQEPTAGMQVGSRLKDQRGHIHRG